MLRQQIYLMVAQKIIEDSKSIVQQGMLSTAGANVNGRTGQNTFIGNTINFTQIGTDDTWEKVSIGQDQVLALKKDNTLYSWGGNLYGQLGHNATSDISIPTQVPGEDWASISGGSLYSMAIKKDGTLWGWGYSGNGELGIGDTNQRNTPSQIGEDADWAKISATIGAFTFGIKTNGTLWVSGYNGNGRTGLGLTGGSQLNFTQVGSDADWLEISGGFDHAIAVRNDGTLWGWGHNGSYALGTGNTTQHNVPFQLSTDTDWKFVSAGDNFSLAIKQDGTLWSWGYNNNGRTGQGLSGYTSTPTQLTAYTDWVLVDAGYDHSVGVRGDGTLWVWGRNQSGQLGIGSTSDVGAPIQVGGDTTWFAAAAGQNVSTVLKGL